MFLNQEFLQILNDDDEPPEKRIKLCKDALQSSDSKIRNRVLLVLHWICQELENNKGNLPVLAFLNNHLNSCPEILAHSSISTKFISRLFEALENQLKNAECIEIVSQCFLEIALNPCNTRLVTKNLEAYFSLLSSVINEGKGETFKLVLENRIFLIDQYIKKQSFDELFIKNLLKAIVSASCKSANKKIHNLSEQLIYNVVFHRNQASFHSCTSKMFSNYNSSIEEGVPKLFYDCLLSYNDESFQECEEALCLSLRCLSRLDHQLATRNFLFFLHMINIKIGKHSNAKLPKLRIPLSPSIRLKVALNLFSTCIRSNVSFNDSINGIEFPHLISILFSSILQYFDFETSLATDAILLVAENHPNLILDNLKNILRFVVLRNKHVSNPNYYQIWKALLDIYSKVLKLDEFVCSVMKGCKKACEEVSFGNKPIVKLNGDSRPTVDGEQFRLTPELEEILENYLENLTRKQLTALANTTARQLKKSLKKMSSKVPEPYYSTYIETICTFATVSIKCIPLPEDDSPSATKTEFEEVLSTFETILCSFGSNILDIEFDEFLVKSFLRLSYYFMELNLHYQYYTIESDFSNGEEIDLLPLILSSDQWSSFSQRVFNFGDDTSKQLMLNISIQKIRVAYLKDTEIGKKTCSGLIKSLTHHLEVSWRMILTNPFMLKTILPLINVSHYKTICRYMLDDVVKNNDLELKKYSNALDCLAIRKSLLYCCCNEALAKKLGNFEIFEKLNFVDYYNRENMQEFFIQVLAALKCKTKKNLIPVETNFAEINIYINVIYKLWIPKLEFEYKFYLLLFALNIRRSTMSDTSNIRINKKISSLLTNTINTFGKNDLARIDWASIFKIALKYDLNADFFVPLTGLDLAEKKSIKCVLKFVEGMLKRIDKEKYCNVLHGTLMKWSHKNSAVTSECYDLIRTKLEDRLVGEESHNSAKMKVYFLALKQCLASNKKIKLVRARPILKAVLEKMLNDVCRIDIVSIKMILENRKRIGNLGNNILMNLWKSVENSKEKAQMNDQLQRNLLEMADDDEFNTLITYITENVDFDCGKISTVYTAIAHAKYLITVQLKTSRQNHMVKCFVAKVLLKILASEWKPLKYLKLLELEIGLTKGPKALLSSEMIDICLQTCLRTGKEISQTDELSKNVLCIANAWNTLLNDLIRYHPAKTFNRLPVFLRAYVLLLQWLYSSSLQSRQKDKNTSKALYAFSLEFYKLTCSFCGVKHDVKLEIPSLVAAYLYEFQKGPVETDVKLSIEKCLLVLIDICDDKAISYLMQCLEPGLSQLLRSYGEKCKNHYKYRGKV